MFFIVYVNIILLVDKFVLNVHNESSLWKGFIRFIDDDCTYSLQGLNEIYDLSQIPNERAELLNLNGTRLIFIGMSRIFDVK